MVKLELSCDVKSKIHPKMVKLELSCDVKSKLHPKNGEVGT
jgi:hypothetical protein